MNYGQHYTTYENANGILISVKKEREPIGLCSVFMENIYLDHHRCEYFENRRNHDGGIMVLRTCCICKSLLQD